MVFQRSSAVRAARGAARAALLGGALSLPGCLVPGGALSGGLLAGLGALPWALPVALVWVGCSPAATTPALRDLPPYEGEPARLFDDSLSLRLANPALAPDGERLLAIRANEADAIFVARLDTITERSQGTKSRFVLVFTPERALSGELPSEPIPVEVRPDHPSHGMVRSQRARLLRTHGVVFLKWFQQDNEMRAHVRVEPDEPALHDAVVAARL